MHLLGGVFLLAAARATRFMPLFLLMLGHCLCFAPTLAMVNSLTFAHMPNPEVNYFRVRMWGAVSWVLIGWMLSLWRRSGKLQVKGADSLVLAAVCSFVMGLYCFTLPHTPPAHTGAGALPFIKALSLFNQPTFLIFMVISFVVTTQLQFYYLGTSRFLEDIGTSHAAIPAAMSIAQVAQVVAMAAILPPIFAPLGYRWIMALGTGFWLVMFLLYACMKPRGLVVGSMALHGLAYAFFFDAAYIYINSALAGRHPRLGPGALRGGHLGAGPVRGNAVHRLCDGLLPQRRQVPLAADFPRPLRALEPLHAGLRAAV